MSYDLTITRCAEREDEEGQLLKDLPEVALSEWLDIVENDSSLKRREDLAESCVQWLGIETADWSDAEALNEWKRRSSEEREALLFWSDGEIFSKYPPQPLISKMVEIATTLNAKVIGEEGEEYASDGELFEG